MGKVEKNRNFNGPFRGPSLRARRGTRDFIGSRYMKKDNRKTIRFGDLPSVKGSASKQTETDGPPIQSTHSTKLTEDHAQAAAALGVNLGVAS